MRSEQGRQAGCHQMETQPALAFVFLFFCWFLDIAMIDVFPNKGQQIHGSRERFRFVLRHVERVDKARREKLMRKKMWWMDSLTRFLFLKKYLRERFSITLSGRFLSNNYCFTIRAITTRWIIQSSSK